MSEVYYSKWDAGLGPNQERWVRELEGQEYHQGRKFLWQIGQDGNDDRFCCLGVGCLVFGLPGTPTIGERMMAFSEAAGPNVSTAPDPLVDKLALCGKDGEARTVDGKALRGLALVNLNDEGLSFYSIAVIIRTNPWLYFEEPR